MQSDNRNRCGHLQCVFSYFKNNKDTVVMKSFTSEHIKWSINSTLLLTKRWWSIIAVIFYTGISCSWSQQATRCLSQNNEKSAIWKRQKTFYLFGISAQMANFRKTSLVSNQEIVWYLYGLTESYRKTVSVDKWGLHWRLECLVSTQQSTLLLLNHDQIFPQTWPCSCSCLNLTRL